MKKIFILVALSINTWHTEAQTDTTLHQGQFSKKGKFSMSSKPYKPDAWEKPYFNNSIKTAFPSHLVKFPEKYTNKLIHLIGIADSVTVDATGSLPVAHILLDNRYWDYTEDYSIQDEVMFISDKGDGKFSVTLTGLTTEQFELIKTFPAEKKLLFVYGNYKETVNEVPVIDAVQIKFIDYKWYTDKIFSYEPERDKDGNVATDKNGKIKLTNFKFYKIATQGQNK
jgi:hypothetical protein